MLKSAFKAAFPKTIPILAGFLFLGFSYGVYMNVSGFSFVYPMVMSIVIFGGSLEFLIVSMLLSPFAPLQVFAVSLMIQARHLFYGISMLEKYKGTGLKKLYLIYGMCDETFSVNYVTDVPKGVDRTSPVAQKYAFVNSGRNGMLYAACAARFLNDCAVFTKN